MRDAQIALFIIDGQIGDITKDEIEVAISSAKKSKHPLVYVYGKDVKDNDEIINYLNRECIYFQHFFDNRDLSAKIKEDLDEAVKRIDRKRFIRIGLSVICSILLCGSLLFSIKTSFNLDTKSIDGCTAQLYLMRYRDVNALTESNIFNDSLLANFKYEDSIMTGNDISVFPIISNDSLITTTPPFFRLKLHNKHRNTIVLIEANLEVDQYQADTITKAQTFIPAEEIPETHMVKVDGNNTEYSLKSFRHNIAYGETDDRYFFAVHSDRNCSFRMRVRAKSQIGDYLYSNYIYVKYIK